MDNQTQEFINRDREPAQKAMSQSQNISSDNELKVSPYNLFSRISIVISALSFGIGLTIGYFTNTFVSRYSTISETDSSEVVSEIVQDNPPDFDCEIYYDAGYLRGLSGNQEEIEEVTSIPDDCLPIFRKGYQGGEKSFLKQFAQARDTTRRSDLYQIGNAIYQYAVENNGELPPGISTERKQIGTAATNLDLSLSLVPQYLAQMPIDPSTGNAAATQYFIYMQSDGRIAVEAQSEYTPEEILRVIR